jgi:hypothetical protein
VVNTKFAPNVLFYLLQKFHIFERSHLFISIYLLFCVEWKMYSKFRKPFLSNGRTCSTRSVSLFTRDPHLANPLVGLSLSLPAPRIRGMFPPTARLPYSGRARHWCDSGCPVTLTSRQARPSHLPSSQYSGCCEKHASAASTLLPPATMLWAIYVPTSRCIASPSAACTA